MNEQQQRSEELFDRLRKEKKQRRNGKEVFPSRIITSGRLLAMNGAKSAGISSMAIPAVPNRADGELQKRCNALRNGERSAFMLFCS